MHAIVAKEGNNKRESAISGGEVDFPNSQADLETKEEREQAALGRWKELITSMHMSAKKQVKGKALLAYGEAEDLKALHKDLKDANYDFGEIEDILPPHDLLYELTRDCLAQREESFDSDCALGEDS